MEMMNSDQQIAVGDFLMFSEQCLHNFYLDLSIDVVASLFIETTFFHTIHQHGACIWCI